MSVIVFDLDDTLYDELTYVRSGFLAVSQYLYQTFGIAAPESYAFMLDSLSREGRGQIFNNLLMKYSLLSKKNVASCLSVYRNHSPQIKLNLDAEACLSNLVGHSLYIVTDGHKLVQKNKLAALGLFARVKFCYITYRYGKIHSKPSPYCFMKICQIEKTRPEEVVYIGDNPNKDFVGIKPLGFRTVRLMQGQYKDTIKSAEFDAELQIHSLNEVHSQLMGLLFH
jgi:putative hydrolase of the HAD superfamily